MVAREHTRRGILKTGTLVAAGLAGCLSSDSPTDPPGGETAGDSAGEGGIASLSVRDYVIYPLAGVHPHVHRRADTQYVIVRVRAETDERTLRRRLSLTLDGAEMSLAERQPVPWQNETGDVAFAVPKSTTYNSGRVQVERAGARPLSAQTLARLNNPPAFAVGTVTASPEEIPVDEEREATVQFDVENTGNGAGEFAASLSGNYTSGASTLTRAIEAGEQRRVETTTAVVGSGDTASLRLDWGTDQWHGAIPVVGR